ncbi:MAG TPA: L,D-transpeptidase [Candidatus Paceibacterota bacterium]|nr:L,D-transpeptidase [Candidatus Paceibacterota bacterium]
MAIPTEQEAHQVLHDYPEQLGELIENTPVNEQGLFVAGDTQRLYVLKNIGAGQIQFEKAYTVTTSEEDWSNVVGSEGTSLGLQWITEVREGFLGEILSEKHKKELRGHFGPPVVTHRGPVLIAKSLDKGGNQLASVITVGLLLWDRFNGSQRGELIHGTNREDILGERASGGCTRMSNVDAVDILQYVKTSALNSKGEMVKKGTPVMVAAKGRVPVYRKPSVQSKARSKELKWDFWGPRK